MPWLKRRLDPFTTAATAVTCFRAPPELHATVASVEWSGDRTFLRIAHLMYLDEIVRRDSQEAAQGWIDHIRPFFEAEEPTLDTNPLVRLTSATDEVYGRVETRLGHAFSAHSDYKPKLAVLKLVHPTFWALWNRAVAEASGGTEVTQLRHDVVQQLDYYAEHGVSHGTPGASVRHLFGPAAETDGGP